MFNVTGAKNTRDRVTILAARDQIQRVNEKQRRRQHLLRGGPMSWGTHGGLQGRVQQLLDN